MIFTPRQSLALRSNLDDFLDSFNKAVFDGFLACLNGCSWAWLITQNALVCCICPPIEVVDPLRELEEGYGPGVKLQSVTQKTGPPPSQRYRRPVGAYRRPVGAYRRHDRRHDRGHPETTTQKETEETGQRFHETTTQKETKETGHQTYRGFNPQAQKRQDPDPSAMDEALATGESDGVRPGHESHESRSQHSESSDEDDSFVLLPKPEKGDYGDTACGLP